MTNLTCHVESCVSNKNGGCCRPGIKVEGPAACKCEETICASYQKKGGPTDDYSASHNDQNSVMDVGCTAVVCRYNKENMCSADKICIDCNCGCHDRSECATFEL